MIQNIPNKFKPFPVYKGGVQPPDFETMPLTFKALQNNSTMVLSSAGTPNPNQFYTSKNGGEWAAYTLGNSIALNQDDTVAFKGTSISGGAVDWENRYTFGGTGKIAAEGNVLSLINFNDDVSGQVDVRLFYQNKNIVDAKNLLFKFKKFNNNYTCNRTFENCTSLTAAPKYIGIENVNNCTNSFANMFQNCSSMIIGPEIIDANSLYNYSCQYMFSNCYALTGAPELPATNVNYKCYRQMFDQCRLMVKPPSILPAKTAGDGCYDNMFNGCYKLSYAPVIGLSSIPNSGCAWMFNFCTSLKEAPQISASYIGEYGCHNMFKACTLLTKIPEYFLSGTNLTHSSCASMFELNTALRNIPELHFGTISGNSALRTAFSGCTSLTAAPEITIDVNNGESNLLSMFDSCSKIISAGPLHIKNTGPSGMQYMFFKCSGLVTPPDMQDLTGISSYGIQQMFRNCSSLTAAANISNLTSVVGNWALANTYRQCSSLTYVPPLNFKHIEGENVMRGFLNGCTSLTAVDIPVTGCSSLCGMYALLCGCTAMQSISSHLLEWPTTTNINNWVYNVAPTGTFYKPFTLSTEYGNSRIPTNWTVEVDPLTLPLTFTGKSNSNAVQLNAISNPDAVVLSTSKNGGAWTEYTIGNVIELASGDTLAISGNNDHFSEDNSNYYQFVMTGTVEAAGNIQSLLNFSDSCTSACYRNMFKGCSSLTKAPTLPATTLAEDCYANMFFGCSSLSSVPQLPATTLAERCYEQMFYNCTNLSSAPQLPATTLVNTCYHGMFRSCTNLLSAPSLPATGLAINCYYSMFRDCTSLSTAPQLPATGLATTCYANMFQNCTSLLSAPQLPATTLANRCYDSMFFGCSNLSSIEVAFTSWTGATDATKNWLSGVAVNGEFTKPAALSAEYGDSRIPTNWTVVNN